MFVTFSFVTFLSMIDSKKSPMVAVLSSCVVSNLLLWLLAMQSLSGNFAKTVLSVTLCVVLRFVTVHLSCHDQLEKLGEDLGSLPDGHKDLVDTVHPLCYQFSRFVPIRTSYRSSTLKLDFWQWEESAEVTAWTASQNPERVGRWLDN